MFIIPGYDMALMSITPTAERKKNVEHKRNLGHGSKTSLPIYTFEDIAPGYKPPAVG